jgi:hypothetical protein
VFVVAIVDSCRLDEICALPCLEYRIIQWTFDDVSVSINSL